MNKNLRNFMMAGAAMLALGASAQTVETVWKHTTGIPGSAWGGEMRFCAALNGKIIYADKTADAQRIAYYDETNQDATLHNLAGIGIGTAIATDEAGNILVNKGFPGATSSTDWMIIPADGSANIDLTITLPSGEGARFDQASNIVGNLLSEEGAYIWICKSGADVVDIIKIVNGAQDADYSYASLATQTGWSAGYTTSTVVHPIPTLTVDDINNLCDTEGDPTLSFVMHNRSYAGSIYVWGEDASAGMTTITKSGTGEGFVVSAKASNEGFQTFALQGKVYYVAHTTTDGTDAGRSSMFGIFDETGALVAHSPIADNVVTAGATINGFAVEPCDENSVYIYQWYPSKIAAKYKFSVPAATPADPLYIFGSFNNWDPAASTEMTYANGVYTVEDVILSAGANFAVSSVQSADWNAVNAARYGFEVNDSFAKIGVNTIGKNEGAMKVALDGVYDITVDLNAMTITLAGEISYPEHIYAIGNFPESNWDTTKSIELEKVEDGVYEGQVTLADSGDGSSYFSIVTALGTASSDWDTVNASARFGAAEINAAIALDEAKAIGSTGSGAYSWMTTPDTYYINVNLNTLEVKLSKNSTGVEGIAVEANDVPAVYYNLQGVEVANPENGLYIVKRGNKVSKELIRR